MVLENAYTDEAISKKKKLKQCLFQCKKTTSKRLSVTLC